MSISPCTQVQLAIDDNWSSLLLLYTLRLTEQSRLFPVLLHILFSLLYVSLSFALFFLFSPTTTSAYSIGSTCKTNTQIHSSLWENDLNYILFKWNKWLKSYSGSKGLKKKKKEKKYNRQAKAKDRSRKDKT